MRGTNYASGVDDEFFAYTASEAVGPTGGRCTVASSKRDTMIAAYTDCTRWGAQAPVGFQNSEGHQATITFDCAAGQKFILFWNAEYRPGRHSFAVSEACGGRSCTGRRNSGSTTSTDSASSGTRRQQRSRQRRRG
jgi:hypothetical protein